ncbi:MAG: hypothetical protein H7Y59_18590 [Anaerolineales bacterium]|nr:hypothetical protein [Anaerolineales bacterium]
MEIYLTTEHAYALTPQFNLDTAHDRIEQKKMNLVAGMLGSLLSRAKPEELQLTTTENRLEPFWLIKASSRTKYDRAATYTVTTTGKDAKSVTVLGQAVSLISQPKGEPTFKLTAIEHCLQELRIQQTFDGLTGTKVDFQKYANFARVEISDLSTFNPEGILLIPPQVRATAVVRQATTEVVQPVKNAQAIHEERVDIETIDLNFRPVYAFEYEWVTKKKKVIIEFDALTGEIRTGGKKWNDQIKGIITRDFLFDVTADAIGTIVPGGSIAVKLVKAVVDRNK